MRFALGISICFVIWHKERTLREVNQSAFIMAINCEFLSKLICCSIIFFYVKNWQLQWSVALPQLICCWILLITRYRQLTVAMEAYINCNSLNLINFVSIRGSLWVVFFTGFNGLMLCHFLCFQNLKYWELDIRLSVNWCGEKRPVGFEVFNMRF